MTAGEFLTIPPVRWAATVRPLGAGGAYLTLSNELAGLAIQAAMAAAYVDVIGKARAGAHDLALAEANWAAQATAKALGFAYPKSHAIRFTPAPEDS